MAFVSSTRVSGCIDQEFTAREASLAFVWSRMRVIDESAKKSKAKLESLSFEDFFEALVHVSLMKALPTDEEVEEAGALDAGVLIRRLKERPLEYGKWCEQHAVRWEDEPSQPVERCVDHLLHLIGRTVKGGSLASDAKLTKLTEKEVTSFVKGAGLAARP